MATKGLSPAFLAHQFKKGAKKAVSPFAKKKKKAKTAKSSKTFNFMKKKK